MSLIGEIQQKIKNEQFEFSKHAVDQSIIRRISVQEVREAVAAADLIEDYPEDKYGSSCLLFGKTKTGRPLRIQCSYPMRPIIKIIMLYEPDSAHWINFKTRRS